MALPEALGSLPPSLHADGYELACWLFLRGLGLLNAIAFASLGVQVLGLVGSRGILPAAEGFPRLRARDACRRFLRYPTLAWWTTSDASLTATCWAGAACGLLAAAGILPAATLLLCWLLYLSLLHCCGEFLGFQWDVLLVETTLLGVLLAPLALFAPGPAGPPAWPVLVLGWWLLVRLNVSSGLVKIFSRDPTWRDLTALTYHYMTQPLPNPLSWRAHGMPRAVHRASCAGTFALELGAPLLLLLPQPIRASGALGIAMLMLLVMATGNFAFFNLNTLLLCVLAFDDAQLRAVLGPLAPDGAGSAPEWPAWLLLPACAAIGLVSIDRAWRTFRVPGSWPRWLARIVGALEPWRLSSAYGLFAVMTTTRPELVVEGSDDGVDWKPYRFRWKVGDLDRRPRQVAPHQPRLDWQAWFAALGRPEQASWFLAFMVRLLEASPPVLRLLETSPFGDRPPRYVRAQLWRYEFTSPEERRRTGAVWKRELLRSFLPAMARRTRE